MSEEQNGGQNEQTLEELFAQLDGVMEMLEGSDLSLEESFRTYQKGMELIRQCNEKIDRVEKKMQIMDEEGELHDF